MQLVIDIPKEAYNLLKNKGVDWLGAEHILNAVANGTQLPKGHGKLIDADKLKQKIEMADNDIMEEDWYKLYDNVISDIDNAHPIIKADKAENESKSKDDDWER